MKTVIFCVNYNSYKELDGYLHTIEAAHKASGSGNSVVVIVADNTEHPENYSYKGDLDVRIYPTNANLGYFGGITFAIEKFGLQVSDFDFSIISNVDLLLPEDFFKKLYTERIDKGIGCIAPSIISNGEGVNRNPKVLTRYSAKELKILRLMFQFPVLWKTYNTLIHGKRREKVQNENTVEREIYAAHGSFMLFTKAVSDFLQNMRFPSFMFCEELFIAENLRNLGLKTLFMPQLVVNDIDHVSTSKMKSSFYFKCNYESLNMILKEYYSE